MAFVQTKTLEYREHKDELACLSAALSCLQRQDIVGAAKILVARQDALLADQVPVLREYDPRADLVSMREHS